MPIRFDSGDDNNGNNDFNNNTNSSGSGPSKGTIAMILLSVFFLFRSPKTVIPLFIIGGIVYYIFFYQSNPVVVSPE